MQGIPEEAKPHIKNKTYAAKIIIIGVYLSTFVAGNIAAVNLLYPEWPILHEYPIILCLLFMVAFLGYCLTAYAHNLAALYWTLHINVQLQILSAYFTTIGDSVQTVEALDVEWSLQWQSEIRTQLMIGIKHHINMVR